jgi:hypothetical protein
MLQMSVSGTNGHFSGTFVTGESYHMLSHWVIPELQNVGLPSCVIFNNVQHLSTLLLT